MINPKSVVCLALLSAALLSYFIFCFYIGVPSRLPNLVIVTSADPSVPSPGGSMTLISHDQPHVCYLSCSAVCRTSFVLHVLLLPSVLLLAFPTSLLSHFHPPPMKSRRLTKFSEKLKNSHRGRKGKATEFVFLSRTKFRLSATFLTHGDTQRNCRFIRLVSI